MWDPFEHAERITEAVESAPSVFNARPWSLRVVAADRIDMHADFTRFDGGGSRWDDWGMAGGEHHPDPLIREAMISCGAALYNLRLAIRVAGHDAAVWLLPDLKADSTLIASVEIMTGRIRHVRSAEEELYEAIWLRHTSREPYTILPVPLPLLVEMEEAAAAEHGWLRVVHPRQARHLLREAARAGDELAVTTAETETASRFRYLRDRASGVPGSALGPRQENLEYPPTRREFWNDPARRFENWRRVQLLALSTDDDRPLDWLRAGQALQHALLTATRYSMSVPHGRTARYHAPFREGLPARHALRETHRTVARYGVTASPLTQLLERQDLRGEARHWPWWWYRRWPRWWYAEVPQMVLRVGYTPVEPVPSPRTSEPDFKDERHRRPDCNTSEPITTVPMP